MFFSQSIKNLEHSEKEFNHYWKRNLVQPKFVCFCFFLFFSSPLWTQVLTVWQRSKKSKRKQKQFFNFFFCFCNKKFMFTFCCLRRGSQTLEASMTTLPWIYVLPFFFWSLMKTWNPCYWFMGIIGWLWKYRWNL